MQDSTPQHDHLQRFIFDNASIRGEWVQLRESWQTVVDQRDYPVPVAKLLGEMLAAAALLTETVKIEGRLVLQIRSDGPVSTVMVECTSDHTIRGLAQWDGEIPETDSLHELTGDGHLAITIEQIDAKQPYQGVVDIKGENLASVLENYFYQSEQLSTRLWLTADEHTAAGLFLQEMPEDNSDKRHEDWSRISQLASTVTPEELIELDAVTLLHRLFNEETVRLLATSVFEFACTCSHERVADTIRLLGREEAMEIVDERGHIEAACEFCNAHYHFDKVDVTALFSDVIPGDTPQTLH